jgi:hypothetical protein
MPHGRRDIRNVNRLTSVLAGRCGSRYRRSKVNKSETYLDESIRSRPIMAAYLWFSFGVRAKAI